MMATLRMSSRVVVSPAAAAGGAAGAHAVSRGRVDGESAHCSLCCCLHNCIAVAGSRKDVPKPCRGLTLERGSGGGGQAAGAPLLLALLLRGSRCPAGMAARALACKGKQGCMCYLGALVAEATTGSHPHPPLILVRTLGDKCCGRRAGRRDWPVRHRLLAHHSAGSCASGGHGCNMQ